MSEIKKINSSIPATPNTPYHEANSLASLINNSLRTPSNALYSTPRYEVSMTRNTVSPSENAIQLLFYWKSRINTTSRDMFLPNVANVLGKEPVQRLYDECTTIVNSIHINNLIIQDVNKLTIVIFNSVMSSLMDDELNHGNINSNLLLLSNKALTHSVLALCYDTSIYLLINNNFDILPIVSVFGITVFDINRIIERFIRKLNQQSSYLITGKVKIHFNKIMENIINYAIWKEKSDIWNYLGSNEKFSIAVEVFIRQLLYFAYSRMKKFISELKISLSQKDNLCEEVWKLIKDIIQKRNYLFRNRNVDVIIICSIYAISKLSKLELTFQELLLIYSSQFPELLHKVKYNINLMCDELALHPIKSNGNIIDFYNNLFVIANNDYLISVKKNILDFWNSKKETKTDNNSLLASATEKRSLTIQETILTEAKETVENIKKSNQMNVMLSKQIQKNESKKIASLTSKTGTNFITPSNSLQETPSTKGTSEVSRKESLQSLNKREEEVKDVLINLAALSPSRSAPGITKTKPISRALPHFIPSPTGTPALPNQSININVEYQFGRPNTSVNGISNFEDKPRKRLVDGYITSSSSNDDKNSIVDGKRKRLE